MLTDFCENLFWTGPCFGNTLFLQQHHSPPVGTVHQNECWAVHPFVHYQNKCSLLRVQHTHYVLVRLSNPYRQQAEMKHIKGVECRPNTSKWISIIQNRFHPRMRSATNSITKSNIWPKICNFNATPRRWIQNFPHRLVAETMEKIGGAEH